MIKRDLKKTYLKKNYYRKEYNRKRIFVQISSYRDPQLLPTINDCLSKAKYPQNLFFGICWQRDDSESLFGYLTDSRFKIIEVAYKDSKGVCWARNQIQQKYNGEDYTLQIDSHHRFVKNWDVKCINMLESLIDIGFRKPLLTSYAPSFNPKNDPCSREWIPWKMNFDRFNSDGFLSVKPAIIPCYKKYKFPIPSRFYSGHFAFSIGKFCEEVQHDPDCYFHGEEISIAIRAFTHGYDLFHPNKIIVWHEYTRKNRIKHWDDHKNWYKMNSNSLYRIRVLLGMDEYKENIDFGKYGLGINRTLKDYEKYAGINFRLRSAQKYTLEGHNPPNPKKFFSDKEWLESFYKHQKCRIVLEKDEIPNEVDCNFWYIGIHNNDGKEIYRQDALGEEIKLKYDVSYWEKIIDFYCLEPVSTWTVWPHSETKGWLKRITKKI